MNSQYAGLFALLFVLLVVGVFAALAQKSIPKTEFETFQQQTARGLQVFKATQYVCSIEVFSSSGAAKGQASVQIITTDATPPDSIVVRYLNLATDTWGDTITYKHCSTANRAPSIR